MPSTRIPSASDYDNLISRSVLFSDDDVTWREKRENQDNWMAELDLFGSDLGFDFLIRIIGSKWVDDDFSISLVCANRFQVRRLDVGHPHTNPKGCAGQRRCADAHMHFWTDMYQGHCAEPVAVASVENCELAFYYFLRQTNIAWTGNWNDFPVLTPRMPGF